MADVHYEVFRVQDQGASGIAHGGGSLASVASANVGASIGRMIDLSLDAKFNITGELEGGVDAGLGAEIRAGGEAAVSAGVRVGLPLDLFTESGIVARAALQARAAGWVQANIKLDFGEFVDAVAGQAVTRHGAPWDRLMRVFVKPDTFAVSAGIFAHVAVAAQAYAEASLAGHLVPGRLEPPGFTVKCEYGVGWGYGAGYSFLANMSLPDPAALLDRIGDEVAAILREELEGLIDRLPQAEREQARKALPLVDLVLPLVLRSSYELGVRLADGTARREDAQKNLVQSFLADLRLQLGNALLGAARAEIDEILARPEVADALEQAKAAEQAVADAIATLDRIADELEGLPASSRDWSLTAEQVLRALATLRPHVPPADAGNFTHGLTVAWCAVALVQHVSRWSTAAAALDEAQAPITPAPPPFISTHIAETIGSPLSAPDMVGAILFLATLGPARIGELAQHRAEIDVLLDLAEAALGAQGAERALQSAMGGNLDLSDAGVGDLLDTIAAALRERIEQELVARILDPLLEDARGRNDTGVVMLIERTVTPSLHGFLELLLRPETLERLGNASGAALVREQISSLLLQTLGRLLITAADYLTAEAIARATADDGIPALAKEIEESDALLAASGAVAAIGAASGVGLALTPHPGDIANLLRISCETMRVWSEGCEGEEGSPRERWFGEMEQLLLLSLADAESIRALWQELADKPLDPPGVEDLKKWLRESLVGDAVRLALHLAGRLLEAIVAHFTWLAARAARALRDAVEKAVEVLLETLANLDRELDKLADEAGRLLGEAADQARIISGNIAVLAGALADERSGAHGQLRDRVRRGLEDEIRASWLLDPAQNVLWQPVPAPLRPTIRDGLIDVANGLVDVAFWASAHLLDAPLSALASAAGWLHARLEELAAGPPLTLEQARAELAAAIRRHINAQDVWFGLRVPLAASWDPPDVPTPFGPIVLSPIVVDLGVLEVGVNLPFGTIVDTIVDLVVASGPVDAVLRVLVGAYTTMRDRSQQAAITQAGADALVEQQQDAQVVRDSLIVTQSSEVHIGGVREGEVAVERATLDIEVTNVNETYFAPQFGVPTRVRVYVNGEEFLYGASWGRTIEGFMLRLELSTAQAASLPVIVMPERLVPLVLPDRFTIVKPLPGELATLIDLETVKPDGLDQVIIVPALPTPPQPIFSPLPQLPRRIPAERNGGGLTIAPELAPHLLDARNVAERFKLPNPDQVRDGMVVRSGRLVERAQIVRRDLMDAVVIPRGQGGAVRRGGPIPPPPPPEPDQALIRRLSEAPRANALVAEFQTVLTPRSAVEQHEGVRMVSPGFAIDARALHKAVLEGKVAQLTARNALWASTGGRLENHRVPAGRVSVSVVVDDPRDDAEPAGSPPHTFYLTDPAA